jgi:hypothetical protein
VQNGYNPEATNEGIDRQQDTIETKSKSQHFLSKACIRAYIIGSFCMTGTGENVGECRLSYVGEANKAHFEIILDTAKPRRAHELGVVAFIVLLLIFRWHGSIDLIGRVGRGRGTWRHQPVLPSRPSVSVRVRLHGWIERGQNFFPGGM